MHPRSFRFANDWFRHPQVWRPVPWRTASGGSKIKFEAAVGDSRWTVRMNDFPDEPLYTVLIDDVEVMHFDDWPWIWKKPGFPKTENRHDPLA